MEVLKLKKTLNCWLGAHQWTCAAEQHIKPTPEQLENGTSGFLDYAAVYCKNCGKMSKRFLKWRKKL